MRGSKKSYCSNINTTEDRSTPNGRPFRARDSTSAVALAGNGLANGKKENGTTAVGTSCPCGCGDAGHRSGALALRGTRAPARSSGPDCRDMALSATIPLATSQRIIPVKVIDENRSSDQPPPGAAGQEQGFVHAHDWMGDRRAW